MPSFLDKVGFKHFVDTRIGHADYTMLGETITEALMNTGGSRVGVTLDKKAGATITNLVVKAVQETYELTKASDTDDYFEFSGFRSNDDIVITVTCIIDGEPFEKEAIVKPEGYNKYDVRITVNLGVDAATLLELSKWSGTSYSSLEEILEDEKCVRQIMTVHASADYIVEVVTDNLSYFGPLLENRFAMKWIGLRDYICDKLMAIADVKTALLGSAHWEYILKDKVPVMTSDTAPEGHAYIYNGIGTGAGTSAFWSFDGNDERGWEGAEIKNGWGIGYEFNNPICVNRVYWIPRGASQFSTQDIVLQGSNDNFVTAENIVDIATREMNYSDSVTWEIPDNTQYFKNYRLWGKGSSFYCGFKTIQFYGRSLNENVPKMTTDTAPYGQVIFSGQQGSNPAKNVFDKNRDNNNWWSAGGTDSAWVGYVFPKPINLKTVYIKPYNNGTTESKNITIFGSNTGEDGSWTPLVEFEFERSGEAKDHYYEVNNPNAYRYFKCQNKGSYNGYTALTELDFYGVSYSEEEFGTDGIEMLYDNGVEIIEIESYTTSTGVVEKRADYIYLANGASSSNVNIHTKNAIDTVAKTYKLERANTGNEFVGRADGSSYWIGISNDITGDPEAYNHMLSYIPNHCFIDISNNKGNKYPTIAWNGVKDGVCTIKKWWLE